MAQFRTIIPPSPSANPIRHSDKILSLGSCFAENIGQKMLAAKFQLLLNPFGITYNPSALSAGVNRLIAKDLLTKSDLFFHKERWHSLAHHSRFSHPDLDICLDTINTEIRQAHEHLQAADVLILTLGTAHVFEHKKSGKVVNNCHRLPSVDFERRLLSVAEITAQLEKVLGKLRVIRPNLRVIFTVSPVRYLRDGLVASQLSKSILRVAIHELCMANNFIEYFPAYELVTDDLRDYRFFAEDMAHPNETAINYVWKAFSETYFSESIRQLLAKIMKLQQAMSHRPFNPTSVQHRAFLAQHFEQIVALEKAHPYLDWSEEKTYFGAKK